MQLTSVADEPHLAEISYQATGCGVNYLSPNTFSIYKLFLGARSLHIIRIDIWPPGAGHTHKKRVPMPKGRSTSLKKKTPLPRNLELWAKLISCDFSKNIQNRNGQPRTQTILSACGEIW